MRTNEYKVDLCVVGGGMAGLCCAIAAARHGVKVVLVQDRPVLGGNASSEIRMWIGGAHGQDNREGGIIEEIFLENFYQNPSLKYTLWDSVLYEKAMAEENLILLLNTSCLEAEMDGNRIRSIRAWQSNAETFHVVEAAYFADCSGDSILAPLTGAKYTYGREAKAEFGESIPPDVADKKTMGMSCLIQTRETDHKVDFIPPKWAYTYETDESLPCRRHDPKNNNYWWIEIGGEWDCIHDTDRCRDELLKICYGVWDHVKNKGDHGADNWELEWIGFLPGKRESRRYIGKYIVTQNDVEAEGRFPDLVAYAGWSMDDHFPEGFAYPKHPTIYHPAPTPWGLPLRAMISENIENLVFAGRNISVTHAALSSSRVMATCAVLGQALGTAVAQALEETCAVEDVNIERLQQTLMEDDHYLPWHTRKLPELTTKAACSAEVVRNGIDRGEDNLWKGSEGETILYTFEGDEDVREIRLVFDADMNRKYHNMPCNYPLVEEKFKLPKTLVKEYVVEGIREDGETFRLHITDNHQRFVKHTVDWRVKSVRLIPIATHGAEDFRVFDFEVK